MKEGQKFKIDPSSDSFKSHLKSSEKPDLDRGIFSDAKPEDKVDFEIVKSLKNAKAYFKEIVQNLAWDITRCYDLNFSILSFQSKGVLRRSDFVPASVKPFESFQASSKNQGSILNSNANSRRPSENRRMTFAT